jgi:hypothetical protein
MASGPAVESVLTAARKLGQHPHDHGWRELYRLFAYGLAGEHPAPHLMDVVTKAQARRPTRSPVHLVTLLGIAVQALAGSAFSALASDDQPVAGRLTALDELLARNRPQLDQLLAQRQNSFTAARRFLVPQVLLAAYFARQDRPATFADLGTGLGILPRQLNSKALFERYADELAWPAGRPVFQPVPLAGRYGVDRGPLPDLDWVRSCYGPSAYYTAQYHELTEALNLPEMLTAEVHYQALDLTDRDALQRFVTERGINAVNLSYTLYEIEPDPRAGVLDALTGTLREPGLIIVTEPNAELTQPGCTVTIRDRAHPAGLPVCTVSDGHFRGQVTPLAGYQEFLDEYPIRFESVGPESVEQRSGAMDAASHDHEAG